MTTLSLWEPLSLIWRFNHIHAHIDWPISCLINWHRLFLFFILCWFVPGAYWLSLACFVTIADTYYELGHYIRRPIHPEVAWLWIWSIIYFLAQILWIEYDICLGRHDYIVWYLFRSLLIFGVFCPLPAVKRGAPSS